MSNFSEIVVPAWRSYKHTHALTHSHTHSFIILADLFILKLRDQSDHNLESADNNIIWIKPLQFSGCLQLGPGPGATPYPVPPVAVSASLESAQTGATTGRVPTGNTVIKKNLRECHCKNWVFSDDQSSSAVRALTLGLLARACPYRQRQCLGSLHWQGILGL